MDKDYEMDNYWKEQERFNREYWKQGEKKDDGYWDSHHVHKDMEYWNDETNGLKHDHVLAKDREVCEAHHEEEHETQKTKEERYQEYKREKAERLALEQNIQNGQTFQNSRLLQNGQENGARTKTSSANGQSLRNIYEAPGKKNEKPKGFLKNPVVLFLASIVVMFMAINYIAEDSFGGSFFCAILSGVVMVNSLKAKQYGKPVFCILALFFSIITLMVAVLVLPELAYTYGY